MASNTAMPSGYEYEFVQEVPDDYICVICQSVMRKPVQTKCGHRFCRGCLDESNKRNPQCPVDRKTITPQDIFEDLATERKILSYKIKCPEQLCSWEGEVRNIENHDKQCDYKVVDCDNDRCSVRKTRQEMVGHVQRECLYRIVPCPLCKNTYTFYKLEQHTSECAQCPVSCPNNCCKILKREQVKSHTSNECSHTIVSCSYESIGCSFKVKRKDLNEHIERHVKQHLTIAVDKILSNEKQMDGRIKELLSSSKEQTEQLQAQILFLENIVEKQMDGINERLSSSKEQTDQNYSYTWKVKDFNQQLETAKKSGRVIELFSEPFYTQKYGYKLKLKLYPNGEGDAKGTHVSIFLIVMRGEYDALLTWPFDWKGKFILMDQKPNPSQRKNIEMSFTTDNSCSPEFFLRPTKNENRGYGKPKFASQQILATENYVVNSELFLKVEFEKPEHVDKNPPTMRKDDEMHYSYIWKVKDFNQQLEAAKKSDRDIALFSEPFYTNKYGYKLKLRLDPNGFGNGKGTHASVSPVIMRGEYDALLTWPFDWKFKFILVDQKPNPSQRKNIEFSYTPDKSWKAFQRPTTDEIPGNGSSKFASQKMLLSCSRNYVVDGTLFLKLELEKP